MYDANELVRLFNGLFVEGCRTELVAGGDEPVYLPAVRAGDLHRLVFTQDYFSSALHEISHWCIAGLERRQQLDFGYWYEPDGRSLQQQQAFELVEVKPQALEWIFSAAAGIKFRVSVDNLNISEYDCSVFSAKVRQQVVWYLVNGLPGRARQFTQQLIKHYQQQQAFSVFCQRLVSQCEGLTGRDVSLAPSG